MFVVIGIAVGFVSAMPLGPISAMAISYRLHERPQEGQAVALAASACDFVYTLLAIIAAAELTALFNRLGPWMQLAGGFLLAGMAVIFFLKSGRLTVETIDRRDFPKSASPVFLTVLLYAANPTIVIYWIALIRTLTSAGWIPRGWLPHVVFAAFVGLGGWLWFNVLFRILDRSRDKIGVALFRTILRLLAAILSGLAAKSLVQAARALRG